MTTMRAIKILIAGAFFLVGGGGYVTSRAGETQEKKEANNFLALSEGQRIFWFEGAFRAVSHLMAMRDQKQGDCAAAWYLDDRENKRKVLERAIARHGNRSETSVVLTAIQNACGPLVPEKKH